MAVMTESAVWAEFLEAIRKRVTQQQFVTWFQNLKPLSVSAEELVVRVPNHFFKEWLAQNYMKTMQECAARVTGNHPQIRFSLDASAPAPAPRESENLEPAPEPPSGQGLRLNEHYTFESFVVGPSNQLAHAAAVAVSESPGRTYNPLFLYGAVGLGKSHLLQAICRVGRAKFSAKRIAYLSCEAFVNEFIAAIQRNDLPAFRARYRQLDFLFIDDIQFLSRAERSQEEFFHTFNDLYNAQKQIVISSDQPPQDLTGLQDRLVSRFKSGLVARIDPPGYEMRVAILRRKAELRGVKLPGDVIEFIANLVTTNIRELDGAITKVTGYASLLSKPVTLDVARTALHEPAQAMAPVTVEDIMRVVTTHFNVRVSDLQSKRRTRSIVVPRQICMHLARELTGLSLEEIGGYFGGRDHSTVLHAQEKVNHEIQAKPSFGKTIEHLKQRLTRGAP